MRTGAAEDDSCSLEDSTLLLGEWPTLAKHVFGGAFATSGCTGAAGGLDAIAADLASTAVVACCNLAVSSIGHATAKGLKSFGSLLNVLFGRVGRGGGGTKKFGKLETSRDVDIFQGQTTSLAG